ncbi:glycosyltransferase family 61 protein [Nocardioides sp. Bht2]|uniref:glycosyltransferase family 61 protein n=1 Tax=Nocardioides sp. Bht2 TaxID=3392297 RepID=UPI0039B51759
MTRLPSRLQPAWPLVKRLHRLASFLLGLVGRQSSRFAGDRALPRRATSRSAQTAQREPEVTLTTADAGELLRRPLAQGTPPAHWIFDEATSFDVAPRFTLSVPRGIALGDYGAVITAQGTLDFETSEYFGIESWREHPLYLRPRLPQVEEFDGTLAVLATRGGSYNYYHFLLDVLPRYGVLRDSLGDVELDGLYVPSDTGWQQTLLAMTGLDQHKLIPARKHSAVQAERLLVPSLPNPKEVAPTATVTWLRERLPAGDLSGRPRRIYVTRGQVPNSRRLVREAELLPLLAERGFVCVEPGGLSIQEQIDTFAAAEVVVAPHGAALTNLVFASPGVRVLELFPAEFVKACFWAISQSIPGAQHSYLVGGDVAAHGPGSAMNKIQADIHLDPEEIVAAVDRLLAI